MYTLSCLNVISVSKESIIQGVIVVYDVTDGDSFENIKTEWMKTIEMVCCYCIYYKCKLSAISFLITQYAPPETPVMILGNKCDSRGPRVIFEEKGKLVSFEINIKICFNSFPQYSWLLSMGHCSWRSVPRQDTMWRE